jgi:hypothetical protein
MGLFIGIGVGIIIVLFFFNEIYGTDLNSTRKQKKFLDKALVKALKRIKDLEDDKTGRIL